MNFTDKFAGMTAYEMRSALAQRKRKLPGATIEAIIENVMADRSGMRPMLKKREQHTRLWKQIVDPAVYELRNVRRMMKLTLSYPTPERTAALEAYAAVIELVIGKLRLNIDKLNINEDSIDDDLRTPSQQASRATPAFPNGKPNGGTYWTDYVPRQVIKKILLLFLDVPKEKHVKRKHPFPVVLDKATSAKRRAALLERTQNELTHIERIIAVELADPRLKDTSTFKHQELDEMRLQASKMQNAIHIIGTLPPNAFIPPTWHGLLTPRTAPGRQPLPKGKTK